MVDAAHGDGGGAVLGAVRRAALLLRPPLPRDPALVSEIERQRERETERDRDRDRERDRDRDRDREHLAGSNEREAMAVRGIYSTSHTISCRACNSITYLIKSDVERVNLL